MRRAKVFGLVRGVERIAEAYQPGDAAGREQLAGGETGDTTA